MASATGANRRGNNNIDLNSSNKTVSRHGLQIRNCAANDVINILDAALNPSLRATINFGRNLDNHPVFFLDVFLLLKDLLA